MGGSGVTGTQVDNFFPNVVAYREEEHKCAVDAEESGAVDREGQKNWLWRVSARGGLDPYRIGGGIL